MLFFDVAFAFVVTAKAWEEGDEGVKAEVETCEKYCRLEKLFVQGFCLV